MRADLLTDAHERLKKQWAVLLIFVSFVSFVVNILISSAVLKPAQAGPRASPSRRRKARSSRMVTPRAWALSSLLPGSAPATT